MVRVQKLVVDSVALIKNAPIKDIGEEIYSVIDVVNEVKDRETKRRLQVLPYDIIFCEPTPENIKHVSDFAKKNRRLC